MNFDFLTSPPGSVRGEGWESAGKIFATVTKHHLNNDGVPLFVVFGSSTKTMDPHMYRPTLAYRGQLYSKFSHEGVHNRLNGRKFSFTTTRERSNKT